MSSTTTPITQTDSRLDPEKRFLSVVPLTPAEAAASSARWERRGLLGRLVGAN